MKPILWLTTQLIWLLTRFVLTVLMELLGCAVRVFYWSVRTYGWGRVGGALGALAASLWLHSRLDSLSLTVNAMGSLSLTALVFWGAGCGLIFGCRRWLSRYTFASASGQYLPASTHAPPEPAGSRSFLQKSTPAWNSLLSGSGQFPPPVATVPRAITPQTASPPEGGDLWSRVVSPTTLQEAWRRVWVRQGGPGSDGLTVETFALNYEQRLENLAAELANGTYRPGVPRWVEIPKRSGGMRRLAILPVHDRIVQQAILLVVNPLCQRLQASCSYAYRMGRSPLQAVEAVERGLAQGRLWVVDADIESFFDSVPHSPLWALLAQWVPDDRVRYLIQWLMTAASPSSGQGLAQGAPLSPLLANLYLHGFDQALLEGGYLPVRYADDFVILCASGQQAERALETATRLLEGLQLRLNAEKTRIVHRDDGFTFLGYLFSREGKRPSDEAISSLNARLSAAPDEALRRRILTGWGQYFREVPPQEISAVSTPSTRSIQSARAGQQIGEEWAEVMEPWFEEEANAVSLLRSRFLGRPDAVGRYWEREGRSGYAPVRRSPTDEELEAHLEGQCILGTFPLLPDGTIRALVFDIDGPGPSKDGQTAALELSRRLVEKLERRGLPPLWIDSGGKGYHLWLCFSEPIRASAARRWAETWLDKFRPFPPDVMVELFPGQDNLGPTALGSMIRLPFGLHPVTGRQSVLLSSAGQPVAQPWPVLLSTPLVEAMAFLSALAAEEQPSIPEAPEEVAPLVQGCALVAALVQKAAKTRHLRHIERLTLLYTLGTLGEAGRNYLHQVIALCSNYNPAITERWIRRLEEGHPPIKCETLKRWLKDHLPEVSCPCIPGIKHGCPVDLLHPRRGLKKKPRQPLRREKDDAWTEVAREIFGEALVVSGPDARQPNQQEEET